MSQEFEKDIDTNLEDILNDLSKAVIDLKSQVASLCEDLLTQGQEAHIEREAMRDALNEASLERHEMRAALEEASQERNAIKASLG